MAANRRVIIPDSWGSIKARHIIVFGYDTYISQ